MIRRKGSYWLASLLFAAFAVAIAAQQQEGKPSQQPESAPVYKAGDEGLENPRLIRQTLPEYTPEAKKERIEGTVLLQAVVRKDGSIDSFKVLETPGYGLEEQAIEEISKNWKFQPGKKDGEPVDVQVSIEVTFTLR